MISVSHLTKRYPGRLAVNDVSFEVFRGEIVGFLGPNGAGKSTTLRMLTGYLPATGGSMEVAGFDVFTQSLEVRRHIGYLPENCPLYPEMRVDEFLRFRAKLRGVGGQKLRRRMREVKALCGLEEVGRRIIGQLSKGYRQRVGLADCLVHDPDILVLDEPTLGLDPNQNRQVRELIRQLSSRHTILLSTHILTEVEMTCQRVMIIHEGRIIASDTPRGLEARLQAGQRVVAEIEGPGAQIVRGLEALPGVENVRGTLGEGWLPFTLDCEPGADPRPEVFAMVHQQGWRLRELRMERSSLEDVFVELTGKKAGGGAP